MNRKLAPLTVEEVRAYQPPEQLRRHLDRLAASHNDPVVLDWGCGRGRLVWWLRLQGWDAHGFEPNETYVENGRRVAVSLGFDPQVLRASTESLADQSFDGIYSVQVVEHVHDLHAAATEMRRLLRVGGAGRHIFPSHRTLVEPHVKLPLVHWFNDPSWQRRAVAAALAIGLPAWEEGRGRPRSERRTEILSYLETQTAYRPTSEILGVLRSAGLAAEVNMRDSRLFPRHPWVPDRWASAVIAALTNVSIDVWG